MTSITAGIVDAAEELRNHGYEVELCEENGVPMLILMNFRLPQGWSRESTDLLLRLPPSFPAGKPDMFWTHPEVKLDSGAEPKQASVIETHMGRQWRRFSWHPQNWTPATDNILTFLAFIERRLQQPE